MKYRSWAHSKVLQDLKAFDFFFLNQADFIVYQRSIFNDKVVRHHRLTIRKTQLRCISADGLNSVFNPEINLFPSVLSPSSLLGCAMDFQT